MKEQVRILAVDDAPFRFQSGSVIVIGVVVRLPNYLEGILRSQCQVDGGDATKVLEEMLMASRFKPQLKAVMIDGMALGGFNIVNVNTLWERTGVPVITVTREPPDLKAMELALRKHFIDWEARMEVLQSKELIPVNTGHRPILISVTGISQRDAIELIRKSVVRGAIPEGLRMAHIIASGLARGESKGRA